MLTGLAFALPVAVWTSTREREISFPAIMRFGLVPLFLFAGAFFPIDQLPAWAQSIAYVTPLYHGVELTRGAVLETLTLGEAAVHVAVLVAYAGIGYRRLPPHVHDKARKVTAAVVTAGLRIVPAAALEVRRPQRMIERSAMVNRRTWLIMFSGFFEPLFYLMSIRIGVGELIGDVTVGGVTIDYAEFVAPALLAASAMNGAIYETTMNVFFKMKYERLYDTVLATPMTPADVALGEIGWAVIRGGLYSVAFLVTMAALGLTASPWIVLALPFSVLIAFAFASVGMAITTYMRSWVDFEYVTAATLPLFLFSATFYPVSSYGELGVDRPAQPAVSRRRPDPLGEHRPVRMGNARPHRRARRHDGRWADRRRQAHPHPAAEVTLGAAVPWNHALP